MCKVTSYITPYNFGRLYDVVISQLRYFDTKQYWGKACDIHDKQVAIWERLEGQANELHGNVGVTMICLHRHLKLSKRTSPYSIIKELREYFANQLGEDIFTDNKFRIWEEQFPNQRFDCVIHDFKNLLTAKVFQ